MVGSAVGQDGRQETQKLRAQADLHSAESSGWDEVESVEGSEEEDGLAALAIVPVRLASCGHAYLFPSTLPSFGSARVKVRYTEAVWQQ